MTVLDQIIDLRRADNLARSWDTYALAAVPQQAGPGQRETMRRCFYAGLLLMWDLLAQKLENLNEADACQLMETLCTEINSYVAHMSAQARAQHTVIN